jgi:hypothetical protein
MAGPYYKNRVLGTGSGGHATYLYNGVKYDGPSGSTQQQYQTSYLSSGPPFTAQNNFLQDNRRANPTRMNMTGRYYRFDSYSIGPWTTTGHRLPEPPWQELVNEALSRLNPNNPVVDLPLFLYELRELSQGLRDLGRYLSGAARSDPGGAYLSYQFGWGPLFSDLRTLLNLYDETEKRLKSLREDAKSKRARVNLPGRAYNTEHSPMLRSNRGNDYWWYTRNREATEESWATTTYIVDPSDLPSMNGSKADRLRWALGLNLSASTVYNMIPWSWLVDYFSTLGSFLESKRGRIPWKAQNMCVMCKQTEVTTHTRTHWSGGSDWGHDSPGSLTIERLHRKVYALPAARVVWSPFLSDGQLTNLLALAASKNKTFLRGG